MFPESSVATTITVLTPISCYYVASFNYGGKKAGDVGLTCRCHLSIFYDSMGWGMTQSFLFLFFFSFVYLFCFVLFCFSPRGGNCCLPQHRRDGFSLITTMPVRVGKGRWDQLSSNEVSILEHV